MPEGCIEVNGIPLFQQDPFFFEENFGTTLEDQQKFFTVMVIQGFFFRALRDGEDERLHLLVALAEGKGLVGVAMTGPGDRDNPADLTAFGLSDDFILAIDFLLFEKQTDLDIKKTGNLGQSCDRRGHNVVLDLGDQRRRETCFAGHILQSQLARLTQLLDFYTDIVIHD